MPDNIESGLDQVSNTISISTLEFNRVSRQVTPLENQTNEELPNLQQLTEGNTFDYSLFISCGIYTLAAGSEYWLMSWLYYLHNIKLPILFALLQNLSWPIQGISYCYARRKYEEGNDKRVVTNTMILSYCLLGSLNAFITITRTVGITSLPPTIYVIVANTEIVFECILAKLYLKQDISELQIFAMCLIIAGVLASLWDPQKGEYAHRDDDSVHESDVIFGLLLSLLSRFASSWNTILADRFLGKDRKTQFGVLECSFFNALIPCFILPWLLLVAPEYKRWGGDVGHRSSLETSCVVALLVTVCGAKYGDRFAKFTIVSKASTMFFAAVDSNMKLFAGLGTILFFQETFILGQGIGFCLIFVSLVISLYDKKIKYYKGRATSVSLESGTSLPD